MNVLREQINEILVKWSMPTRQACINDIMKLFRAFGFCDICYGKGYSTQAVGYKDGEDLVGHGQEVLYCNCDRGKQLEKLFKVAS
jgi:hypothetical protein